MSWRKPKFFYNTGIASLTATPTPPTSNPVSNLLDGLDGTQWKAPDATTQVIKHDKGARRKHPFDFLTLVGHNFAQAQPDIKLEYSDDDVTYQTALAIAAKATFARASTAYHSDGAQALSGVPRYEAGRDNKTLGAVMVEEGTTNLLTANQASVETDTTGFTSLLSATLSRDTIYFRHGAASLKVVTPGSVINEGAQVDGPAGTNALPYAGGVWVLAPLNATMELVIRRDATANATTVNFTGTGAWQWVSAVVTLDAGATSMKILVRTRSTAQAITFYVDMNQLEQKAHATSWQLPGTARANETHAIPVTGAINPSEGTVAIWVNINDASKRIITNVRPMILQIPHSDGTYGIRLFHSPTSSQWYIETRNGTGGTGTNAVCNDSLTPNGWHQFACTWKQGSPAYLYIDSALAATISSPEYPAAFAAEMRVGYYTGQLYYGNADGYDDLQIFNRALTNVEIVALYGKDSALPHPHSPAFFTFDENLVNGVLLNPAIVQEFTQLSSRFQKLTLSNSLVAPQCSIGYWGEGKELDYVDKSFDPGGIERKANVNMSETGFMSGVHEKYTERSMTLAWEDAEDSLYRILAAWADTVGLLNFLVGWELESHPDEIYLMHADPKFICPLDKGGAYRDITVKLLGRKL